MRSRLNHWLRHIPARDDLERQQAILLQIFLMGSLPAIALGFGFALLLWGQRGFTSLRLGSVLTLMLGGVGAWAILRRGHFIRAVWLIILAGQVGLSLSLVGTGLSGTSGSLFGFFIPITLAGLLLGRRGLAVTLGLSALSIILIALLQQAGRVTAAPTQPVGTIVVFFYCAWPCWACCSTALP